jgi:hypothetical protein
MNQLVQIGQPYWSFPFRKDSLVKAVIAYNIGPRGHTNEYLTAVTYDSRQIT